MSVEKNDRSFHLNCQEFIEILVTTNKQHSFSSVTLLSSLLSMNSYIHLYYFHFVKTQIPYFPENQKRRYCCLFFPLFPLFCFNFLSYELMSESTYSYNSSTKQQLISSACIKNSNTTFYYSHLLLALALPLPAELATIRI